MAPDNNILKEEGILTAEEGQQLAQQATELQAEAAN
ncbi:hypothetical protein VTN00DRAFT_4568 [Thermoascus crustaceus]